MLSREEVKNKLKKFKTPGNDDENGVLLFISDRELFISIAFSEQMDICDEECDACININTYYFDDDVFFEYDGGEMEYNTENEKYGNDITNAVYDSLMFMFDSVPDFIPIMNFEH